MGADAPGCRGAAPLRPGVAARRRARRRHRRRLPRAPGAWPTPRSPACPPSPGCGRSSAATARLRAPRLVAPALGRPRVDDGAHDGRRRRRRWRPATRGATPRWPPLLAVVVGLLCLARLGRCGSASSPTCCPKPVLVGYMAGIAVHHDRQPARQAHRHRRSRRRSFAELGVVRCATSTTCTCRRSSSPLACSCSCFLGCTGFSPRCRTRCSRCCSAAAVVGRRSTSTSRGVAVVGAVPAGLPRPSLPDVSPTSP